MAKGKELELRLQRTEQQLSVFQKVSRFMVRDLSLSDVLQGIVSLVVEFTHCDSCLIYLLDGEDLVLCASNTPHPSTIGKLRMRSNEGLTGWVARERVVGVISVQHRLPHQHTGSEMEVLATVGEQLGCMLVLARMSPSALESANHVELILSSGPVAMKQ